MKNLYLLIIASFLTFGLSAQEVTKNDIFSKLGQQSAGKGKITIKQDLAAKNLVRKHVEANDKLRPWGYRIVIFSGSGAQSERTANQVRSQFKAKYYKTEAYTRYFEPNFRVHVGDFRTKSEALKLYKKIKKDYRSAYIIKDRIEFPDL